MTTLLQLGVYSVQRKKCLIAQGVLAIRNYDVTSIVKYVDETTLLVKVNENETDLSQEFVNQFFSWPQDNAVACNPKKCNELILMYITFWDQLFYRN